MNRDIIAGVIVLFTLNVYLINNFSNISNVHEVSSHTSSVQFNCVCINVPLNVTPQITKSAESVISGLLTMLFVFVRSRP